MKDSTLELITRDRCPLCTEAEPVVRRAARLSGFRLRLVDVGSTDALLSEFQLRIPVVREVDGMVLAEGEIEFWPLFRRLVTARIASVRS